MTTSGRAGCRLDSLPPSRPRRAPRGFRMGKQTATGEGHFFTSAVQLTTKVSGAFGSVSTIVLSRNFCPSRVTA